jgi:hypothetical protein
MTTAGWIFMLCSLGFVVTLNVFCFRRVLSRPTSSEHLQAPVDIDTLDRDR